MMDMLSIAFKLFKNKQLKNINKDICSFKVDFIQFLFERLAANIQLSRIIRA
jgi:hypothetical protein